MKIHLNTDPLNEKKHSITLSDLNDLSFLQIYILIVLGTFTTHPVRFTLLNQINEVLFQDKQLSPSTFYNTLQKLEQKGFISFQEDEKTERAKSIGTTHLGKLALKMISQLMIFSNLDLKTIFHKAIPQIIDKTNLTPVRSLLLIHFDEIFDVELFNMFFYKYSQELYILANDETFNRYLKRGITSIHQTKFQKSSNKIREPNDHFDATILVRYQRTTKLFGVSEKIILQEAKRVSKPGSKLIIITIENMPQTNHVILDSLTQLISTSPFYFSLGEKEIVADLQEIGIENIDVYNLNGVIVGCGNVL